jgi:hypothetical protein
MLQMLLVLLPAPFFLVSLSTTASVFTAPSRGPQSSVFEESFVASEEREREGARQSKQVLRSGCRFALSPFVQQRDDRLRSVLIPVALPLGFFAPRKLSPPAAQDEPFLG